MKNKFALFCSMLIFFCASMTSHKTYASHAAGGEIIYEWISDSTYRIYFKFYRDCTGISEADSESLCITNTCGITASTGSFFIHKWTGPLPTGNTNGDPVSAGCSQYKNKCDSPNSTIPGYREWWYYHIWTAGGQCNSWTFSVGISGRNSSMNIVPGPGGGLLHIETEFNNYNFEGNSSPFFSVKPIPYVCINQPFTYNNGAIDPDGDSMTNEMIQPLDGACGTAPSTMGWATGTPAFNISDNPLQTNRSFSLNAATGQMIFTATQGGASTITTKVSEYYTNPRKHGYDVTTTPGLVLDQVQHRPKLGTKIGHIMRDVQVQVLQCSTVAPIFTQEINTIIGGGFINNKINGCIGQTLEFDFYVKSINPDAILSIEDNHIFSMPTAQITYTNLLNDSLHGHFKWTPNKKGPQGFIVITKDTTCDPPGIMLYYPTVIDIFIWDVVTASPDTAVCPGETAFLDVTGGANYQWTVVPGGGPITQLNNTTIHNPVSTTTQKTTFIVTSTANSFCPNNKDSVTVDVLPGLVFTPMEDTVTCPDNPVKLDPKSNPPAGVKYTSKWTPSTYLDDSTKAIPTTTPKTPTKYTLILTSTANQCKGFDTVMVDVLTGFKIDNIDTAICEGQTVDVRGIGDSRYKMNWTAASLASGVFSDPKILTPVITPLNQGKDRYKITFSKVGCRDTSFDFQIDKQPIPDVTVDNDAAMCFGDTMQMNGVIDPVGYPFDLTWTPGSSLTNPKIANPIFNASQNTTLILTAKTSAGCTGSDTVVLEVFPAAFLKVSNDTAICPGESAQLHVSGKDVKSFRWTPDIRINNTYSFDPIVSPPATTEYRVYATDVNLCSDTQKIIVTVLPKATMELPDSVRLYPGESYQMEPRGNCSYYSWFPPLGLTKADLANPIAKPEVNTRYFVTGTTEAGCTISDSINVLVSAEIVIDLPNGFTPGSSTNGKFKILHLGTATLKNFSIYNRWGAKVYESTDLNGGWDGTYKNEPQPMGVYVYTVDAVSPTGRKFTKQGNVTLIR